MGGLHIIGTERHESRRIDNQLRGRAGRQGDPGSSRSSSSLEDDLMRKFAGEWVSAVLTRLGMQEGEAIESRMVTRRIEGAQKKVEERNFDIRKNLLEYDEVMDEQRKRVYSFRQSLLEGAPPKDMILEMIDSQIEDAANRFLADDYGTASFAEWVSQRLGIDVTPRDLKGATLRGRRRDRPRPRPSASSTRPSARPSRRTFPPTPSPRNGPGRPWRTGPTPGSSSTSRRKTSGSSPAQDGEEFEFGRDDLEEFLHEKAEASIEKLDLAPAKDSSSPTGAAARWRAGPITSSALAIDPESWAGLDRAEIVRQLQAEARKLYARQGSRAARADRDHAVPGRSLAHTRPPATTGRGWRPGRRNGSTRSSTPTRSGPCFGPRSSRS